MARVVSVAVPVPALGLLSYEVPSHLHSPEVGARVLVPLGTRVVTGCVVGRPAEPGAARLKPLVDILDVEGKVRCSSDVSTVLLGRIHDL